MRVEKLNSPTSVIIDKVHLFGIFPGLKPQEGQKEWEL